jgi:hypothetical protein
LKASRDGLIAETIEEEEKVDSHSSNIYNDDIGDQDFRENEDNLLDNLDQVIDTEENDFLEEKSYILDTNRHKE